MINSGFSSDIARDQTENTSGRTKTFAINGKCFDKGVGCTWRNGNQFCIYPRSQNESKGAENIGENRILNIRQDILLFTPILRKLVNESNGTYLQLQKAAEAAKTTDNQVEFLKLSRQYRSIIRVCIESLQEAAEKETNGVEKNNLLSCVTIFYSVECIWHLCEILYIDNIPGDVVLPFLLEWVRFHFPCHEQTAAQLLEACEKGSEDHVEYWDTVVGMVVQGRVDVARALLKLHSEAETNEFKLVDNSLRSMPVYSVYGGISTGEFTILWKHWQAECRSKLMSRAFTTQPKLELIMNLVIGDYASFESIRGLYSSWFDLLGGWLLYTSPWARRGRPELGAAGAACAGMRPARLGPLDHLVRALLAGDLHQVVHDIQQLSDNNWFATHLTDMLFHCGSLKILDKHQTDVTSRLRDSLILDYGCMLMEHKSLWSAGLSYLATCPPEGRVRAELMLERVPLESEAKAMRVIAEAKKYDLLGVVETVSASMSARRAGGVWWARAPPAALLLLLGKYCEFHRLYSNKEFKKAGKLLITLLTSKIAPDYFWETLLLDTLPLLESDEPIFSSSDTYEIMLCLELYSKGFDQEKADLLRLALTRNLARTVLIKEEDS